VHPTSVSEVHPLSRLLSNTGPSVQTQIFPVLLSTTQQRQAPIPHAIVFSRETSQGTFMSSAWWAIALIIPSGPQQYILSNLTALSVISE
jgi:hypothetical protein